MMIGVARFFRRELLFALQILNQGDITQDKICLASGLVEQDNHNSYLLAGLNTPVDYDGDGHRDILDE